MSQPCIYCGCPVRYGTVDDGYQIRWVCDLCGARKWIAQTHGGEPEAVYQEHMENGDQCEVNDANGVVIEVVGLYRQRKTIVPPAGCLFVPKSEEL